MNTQGLTQGLQELRHHIKADAEKKLAAVDVLLKHLNQDDEGESQESLLSQFLSGTSQPSITSRSYGNGEPSSVNGSPETVSPETETINVAQEVREAIDATEGSFRQPDITRIISTRNPNATFRRETVSNTIGRLMKRGYIRRVRKSHGSLPSVYRKSDAWPPPMIDDADLEEEVLEEHNE